MNKLFFTALALLGTCTAVAAEDYKGETPKSGGTYCLYNVGKKQFLGSTEEYAISSRNTEASASMYLYQNSVYNRIAAMPQMPGKEFEAAQWLLVDANSPETAIEGVKTDGAETEQKQTHAKGVHNIGGQQVRTDSNTDGLQEGIYIVNGKKTLLKK